MQLLSPGPIIFLGFKFKQLLTLHISDNDVKRLAKMWYILLQIRFVEIML